jgi:glyoxylase-like metal-dependent hydrolase (beta-lactamase superfamily II)
MMSATVERVSDQVWRIPLPLPMRDLKLVNAYVIRGADGLTLVDPGWANAESEAVLVSGLQQLGCTPADVRRILVTHAHWDHYTQAVKWQREFGVKTFLGRGERHTIEAFDTLTGVYPNQVQRLRRGGASDLADDVERLELQSHERDMPFSAPDVWLDGGEQIDCGSVTILAHSTPGHTRGHIVYEDRGAGLVFTGDHILPRITPSVGFERAPQRLALQSYLESLRLSRQWARSRMLPAHGAVTDDVAARAQELLDHHEHRLDEILALVTAGAETAYDVARHMRWTRRQRTLDELGTVHGMTAVLEVSAHLDLLLTRGVLAADVAGSTVRYRVA